MPHFDAAYTQQAPTLPISMLELRTGQLSAVLVAPPWTAKSARNRLLASLFTTGPRAKAPQLVIQRQIRGADNVRACRQPWPGQAAWSLAGAAGRRVRGGKGGGGEGAGHLHCSGRHRGSAHKGEAGQALGRQHAQQLVQRRACAGARLRAEPSESVTTALLS